MASGIGWFEWDLTTDAWEWTPPVAALFGFDPENPRRLFAEWLPAIFVDDVPKLHSAVETAAETGSYYVEFRVRHSDRSVHWIAGKGEATKDETGRALWLTGVYYEITDRKQWKRDCWRSTKPWRRASSGIREEARTLEILNRTGAALASEFSLERLVQMVTDAGVELAGAEFGAFFYNLVNEAGEAYTFICTVRCAREAFADSQCPAIRPYSSKPSVDWGRFVPTTCLSDPR